MVLARVPEYFSSDSRSRFVEETPAFGLRTVGDERRKESVMEQAEEVLEGRPPYLHVGNRLRGSPIRS